MVCSGPNTILSGDQDSSDCGYSNFCFCLVILKLAKISSSSTKEMGLLNVQRKIREKKGEI
jgi:hypothetical protein